MNCNQGKKKKSWFLRSIIIITNNRIDNKICQRIIVELRRKKSLESIWDMRQPVTQPPSWKLPLKAGWGFDSEILSLIAA